MSARVLCAVGAIALIAGCTNSSEDAQVLSPEFAASRGYDAYNAGNMPRAEAYFEIALEADPENPYARVGLDEVRATMEGRTRAAQVVQASQATIVETPGQFTDITRERIEQYEVAIPAEVQVAPVEVQVVETVAESVEGTLSSYTGPSSNIGTINVETAPVPITAISPNPLDGDGYQTVGSYETYLASLDAAVAPEYVASAMSAPYIETGVVLASVPIEGGDIIDQASFDTDLTIETVAVIPDISLDYTAVATAYPVQDVLEYGQPLGLAESGTDVVVQTVTVPTLDGGQGVAIAASGPAGSATVYVPTLDMSAQPPVSGAQSVQPE